MAIDNLGERLENPRSHAPLPSRFGLGFQLQGLGPGVSQLCIGGVCVFFHNLAVLFNDPAHG